MKDTAYHIAGWLTVAQALKLLEKSDGTNPKKNTVLAWCADSVREAEEDGIPPLRRNDGSVGCMKVFNRWYIHQEAINNFEPPKRGNPNWTTDPDEIAEQVADSVM